MATRGTKASGGTDFVTGYTIDASEANTDLNNAFSAINNPTISDSGIIAVANIDPSKIGDYSADPTEYKAIAALATRPAAATPDDFTTFDVSLPTDLEGEIARLRKSIDEIAGMVVNSSGNVAASEWYAVQDKGFLGVPCGTAVPTFLDTAPAGWLLLGDTTIGSAASGANYAAQKAHELYRVLYNKFSNTICPVTGGRGATADADFAANKPMRLPLVAGRVLGIAGTPASANRIDAVTGTQGLTGTTPVAGTSTTVFFIDPATSSGVTSDYVGHEIRFTSGALDTQVQTISAYDGDTHQITVDTVFTGTPTASVTYVIYPLNNSMFNLSWASGPTIDDALNGYTIEITGGTGTLESRTIADYDASQRKITITGTWTTNPDHTTTYSIYKTLTTRAAGASLGTENALSTIDKLPVHTHPAWQSSSDGATLDRVRSAHATTNFIGYLEPSAGGGASQSLYQPTLFLNWMVKL